MGETCLPGKVSRVFGILHPRLDLDKTFIVAAVGKTGRAVADSSDLDPGPLRLHLAETKARDPPAEPGQQTLPIPILFCIASFTQP